MSFAKLELRVLHLFYRRILRVPNSFSLLCSSTPSASVHNSGSISPRQAYRYLQQAQRLKEPLAVIEPKLAFTVKLPPSLIQRVRLYASVRNLSISEVVSRALLALLPRGRGRG
jgi:hypothetical protein